MSITKFTSTALGSNRGLGDVRPAIKRVTQSTPENTLNEGVLILDFESRLTAKFILLKLGN